jgi:transcription factor IIIB 90 kDa subunit
VEGIASKLSLKKVLVDAGKRYYKLAYEKNFI